MRKVVRFIHLWLGLISGVVVFILAITGCIYAFQSEIQDSVQDYRYVSPQAKTYLSPNAIGLIAQQSLPDKHLHSVSYSTADRSAVVSFYQFDPEYYYLVYINPYDGQILKVKNMDEDFFRFILLGHYYLWLPPTIGQPIAAISTLIFFLLIISGIFLWFPRNKNAIKQRFRIKWGLSWKRLNYDLHSVIGFYASWGAVIFCITGLVMGFTWFAEGYYECITDKEYELYYESFSSSATKNEQENSITTLWQRHTHELPYEGVYEIHFPETDSSSIAVSMNPDASTYWQTDYRYFDAQTLDEKELKHLYSRYHENASNGEKLMRMNYDIHTGGIWGFGGKLLAFVFSLAIASLPVTGVLMYLGRKKSKS